MICLPRYYSNLLNKRTLQKCILTSLKVLSNSNIEVSKNVHTQHTECSSMQLTCLKSRGLVRLHGADTVDFLQGLVTNDVHELMRNDFSVQYSFMLNVQGRVLYDLFLFNVTGDDGSPATLFIDVPAPVVEEFIGLLKIYKLRRKVDISNVSNEFQVWSHFPLQIEDKMNFNAQSSPPETVVSCPDPRIADFGVRSIRTSNADNTKDAVDECVYRESRYKWGLPEGVDDLPPGNCFPLESNGTFMNAVSLSKGCYIGQELTARTHHTGVTRKRLMPLVFTETPANIEKDATIKNEKSRNAGKFRGSEGKYGLGLVRLAYLNESLSVATGDGNQVSLTTHKPQWWPQLNND